MTVWSGAASDAGIWHESTLLGKLGESLAIGVVQLTVHPQGKVAMIYVTSLVLSAVLNMLLIEVASCLNAQNDSIGSQVLYLHARLGFLITTVFVGALNYVAMVRYGFSTEEGDGLSDEEGDEQRDNPKDVVVLSFDPIVDLSLAEIRSIGDRFSGAMGSTKKQWAGAHHA